MKKLFYINSIWFALLITTTLSLWNLPLTPLISFVGNRSEYQRDFSLDEINIIFLKNYNPAITINYEVLTARLISLWFIGAILLFWTHFKFRESNPNRSNVLKE